MTRALIIISIVLASTATAADAQPRDPDQVKRGAELFDQGRALMAAKNYPLACARFAESLALDPAIGTKLNLANCFEQRAMYAEAHALFEEAVTEASAQRLPQQVTFAREHAAALEARLLMVTIRVPDPAPDGLVVSLGGEALPRALWSTPRFVAPGAVDVEASAPGRETFHGHGDGAAGTEVVIEVTLPPADALLEPRCPRGPDCPAPPPPARRSRLLPILTLGAGGALLVGGSIAGLLARGQWSDARSCARDQAQPIEHCNDLAHSAGAKADVATGLFIGGAAVATVGVVLWIRARRGEHATVVAPTASADGAGLIIAGEL